MIGATLKLNVCEISLVSFEGNNPFAAQRYASLVQFPSDLDANLAGVAACDYIVDPVLHHKGKIGALIAFTVRCHSFPSVFESITVKTVMNRNTIEALDTRQLREFINDTRGEQKLRRSSSGAIRAIEIEAVYGGPDLNDPSVLQRDGLILCQLLARLVEEREG